MVSPRLLSVCVLMMVTALVAAACGEAAAPTATPASAEPVTATPSAVPAAPTVAAEATAPAAFASTKFSSYSPEQIKDYLSKQFLVPGMAWGQGEVPQYGGHVNFSNRGDLEGADPYQQISSITNSAMLNSMEGAGGLIRAKKESSSEPEPFVAESWEPNADFTQWTFKLRRDIKWHDGKAFTAADVKYWLDMGSYPLPGRKKATALFANYGNYKEAKVVDDYTITLILPEPQPFLLETVINSGNVITAPAHLMEPIIKAGNVNPQMTDFNFVSIGPFKYDKYQPGSSFRVVRSDMYFEKDEQGRALPYLDSIFWAFIPDPSVAVSALRAGRIDGTSRGTGHHMTPDMVNNIKKTLGDKAWFARLPYLGWGAGFNTLRPPFNDINLRRAVNLYSDRREQAQLVYGGFGIENAIMHPGSYWWNPDSLKWPGFNAATKKQDQAEALRLVRESGVTGSQLTPTSQRFYIANGEYLDLVLRQLGFKTTLEVGDALEINEKIQKGNYQVYVGGLSPSTPNQLLSGMLTSNPLKSVKHEDPRIDEYHKRISTTVDPAERRKVLWEAEYYVAIDRAYVVNWSREEAVIAYRTYIKGIWVPHARVHDLADNRTTWIDKSLR